MLDPDITFRNSDTDGADDSEVPVSTDPASKHVTPSEVASTVKNQTFPREGNSGIDTLNCSGGSIASSGSDQIGNAGKPRMNSHVTQTAGSAVPTSKSIVRVPSA